MGFNSGFKGLTSQIITSILYVLAVTLRFETGHYIRKLDVLDCLCRSIRAGRLLTDLSVRLVIHPSIHPSIFPSSACLLGIPESCILIRYVNDVTFSVSCTEWQLQIVCIYENTLLRLNTGAFDIIAVTLGGSVTQTIVLNSTPHPQIHCVNGSVFH
jgi:hypothetical protein